MQSVYPDKGKFEDENFTDSKVTTQFLSLETFHVYGTLYSISTHTSVLLITSTISMRLL